MEILLLLVDVIGDNRGLAFTNSFEDIRIRSNTQTLFPRVVGRAQMTFCLKVPAHTKAPAFACQ